MADGGIGEAALMSAVIGGGVSAATGQDPLKGMLLGGLLGGAGGLGGLGSLGATAPTTAALEGIAAPGALFGTAAEGALANPLVAETALGSAVNPFAAQAAQQASQVATAAAANPEIAQAALGQSAAPSMTTLANQVVPAQSMSGANTAKSGLGSLVDKFTGMPIEKQLLYGGAASLAAPAVMSMFKDKKEIPGEEKYDGPLSKFHYNPSSYVPTAPAQPVPYQPTYTNYRTYAGGGLADLGAYSDGGQMLKGPGDGMSDDIPAKIANKQPARLANEEFVVPADVVSHLGNGSSDAGAKQLYKMMDRVRQARTGTKKQGKQINPEKYLA
jgi:hypothetical protein